MWQDYPATAVAFLQFIVFKMDLFGSPSIDSNSPGPESFFLVRGTYSTCKIIFCQFTLMFIIFFLLDFPFLSSPNFFSNVLRCFVHRRHLKKAWFASCFVFVNTCRTFCYSHFYRYVRKYPWLESICIK